MEVFTKPCDYNFLWVTLRETSFGGFLQFLRDNEALCHRGRRGRDFLLFIVGFGGFFRDQTHITLWCLHGLTRGRKHDKSIYFWLKKCLKKLNLEEQRSLFVLRLLNNRNTLASKTYIMFPLTDFTEQVLSKCLWNHFKKDKKMKNNSTYLTSCK